MIKFFYELAGNHLFGALRDSIATDARYLKPHFPTEKFQAEDAPPVIFTQIIMKAHIHKAKSTYFSLPKQIFCPAFQEEVHIDRIGWEHIMKGKERRQEEIQQRIRNFGYIPQLLQKSFFYQDHQKMVKKSGIIYFYSVQGVINNKIIRLIIRQIGAQRKHFYSLIYKGKTPRIFR